MEDWVGRVLSKVRVERMIGRGGMADVYIGRHTTLDRPMAVKILHAHMTTDSDLRRRFEEEAKAVSALRHPNIVQVVDFDVVDDRPYIIMELLEGMSLGQFLRELHSIGHSLPLETIVRMISGIATALDYAHQRGIVHRDVKPANIVLRKGESPLRAGLPLADDVEPILTDFGVARIASASTRTASGTVLGTPAYMSPEQVQGLAVDKRSDIYSLGIILYEMLAGRLPFDPETDTPASILYKHVHESPPPLPNIPDNVRAVTDKALAKDLSERYQRAGNFARDLESAVAAPAMPSTAPQVAPEADTALATEAAAPQPTGAPVDAGTSTIATGLGGLSGLSLVGAFALGAVVLAGGVFLGITLLSNLLGDDESAAEPTPVATSAVAAQLPTEEPQATAPSGAATEAPTPVPSGPQGAILIGDSSVVGSIQVSGAPDDGFEYQVWLLSDTAEPLLLNPLGQVAWSDGRLAIQYSHTGDESLLGAFQSLQVSHEPVGSGAFVPDHVRFEGQLDSVVAAQLRLAIDVNLGARVLDNLLAWLPRQATHFQSHAGLALIEIGGGNLPGAKVHSEHTINIAEGRSGEHYADWNGNGSVENPGDDVGLLTYLKLVQAAALGFGRSQELAGRVDDLPDRIAADAANLEAAVLSVRDAARQVAGADEIGIVTELGLDTQLALADVIKADIERLAETASATDLIFSFEIFAVPQDGG